MLSALLAASFLLTPAPQGFAPVTGDHQQPTGRNQVPGSGLGALCISMVDIGQGDAIVIKAPDGTCHVYDGGLHSTTVQNAIYAEVTALAPTSFGSSLATHYDNDHIGSLDQVISRYPFTVCYDRGDVNRSSSGIVTDYLIAARGRRSEVQPGQVIQLGGGATYTVLAVNGNLAGGGSVFVSCGLACGEENARSIAGVLRYGNFSMWLGGDLSGGGGTTPDVETPASAIAGDVDVVKMNHHGSSTSTNQAFLDNLAGEVYVNSCRGNNPYNRPARAVVDRVNNPSACRCMFCTSHGQGELGFAVTGTTRIATDGVRYRVTGGNGEFLDYYCDETPARAPTAQDLRITEIHRNPAAVSQVNGEYFEIMNISPAPVSLRGVSFTSTAGSFTLATDQMLVPGRPLVISSDQYPARNGGLPLGLVWPYQSFSLGDVSDTLTMQLAATALDQVTWAAGFPGGPGIAAERVDLLGPSQASNFAAATTTYGAGDTGSPGLANSVDASQFEPESVSEVIAGGGGQQGVVKIHISALSDPSSIYLSPLAAGRLTSPIFVGTMRLGLVPDAVLALTLAQPAFFGITSATPHYHTLALTYPNHFAGFKLYYQVFVLRPPPMVGNGEVGCFTFQ